MQHPLGVLPVPSSQVTPLWRWQVFVLASWKLLLHVQKGPQHSQASRVPWATKVAWCWLCVQAYATLAACLLSGPMPGCAVEFIKLCMLVVM